MSTTDAPRIEQAHLNDPWSARFAPHTFAVRPSTPTDPRDPYAHCSYCGSITVADMLTLMQTTGTKWSASDWKYGWPHKFYLDAPCEPFQRVVSMQTELVSGERVERPVYSTASVHHLKFYSVHLIDATDDQLSTWNEAVAPTVGVYFYRDDAGALTWQSVKGAPGMHGVIA
jgi:hypothetical protein